MADHEDQPIAENPPSGGRKRLRLLDDESLNDELREKREAREAQKLETRITVLETVKSIFDVFGDRDAIREAFAAQAALPQTPPATPPEQQTRRGRHTASAHPAAKGGKGDLALLGDNPAVSFRTAAKFLGIGVRQVQKLVKKGCLSAGGGRNHRKVTTASVKQHAGLSIEKPNNPELQRTQAN